MKLLTRCMLLFSAGLLVTACSPGTQTSDDSSEPQTVNVTVAETEPTNTPVPQPTLIPTPTLAPLPDQVTAFTEGTLETIKPSYVYIRRNMSVMKRADIPVYSENISGRFVGNWQGQIAELVELDGETKVVIEMEPENERPRNDIVIHNLAATITSQLAVGETIAFSGVITEIGQWEQAMRMIHIACQNIQKVES